MIAPDAADDFVLVGLAGQLPIEARGLESRFVRLRTAGGKVETIDAGIKEPGESLGQCDGRAVCAAGVARRVWKFIHLPRGGVGQFAASVTGDNIPQSG